MKVALLITFVYQSRSHYDVLLFRVGAEPTEYFLIKKHQFYTKYQRSTRLFFPIEIPFVDHGRVAFWPKRTEGWPFAPSKKKANAINAVHNANEGAVGGGGLGGTDSLPCPTFVTLPSCASSLPEDIAHI